MDCQDARWLVQAILGDGRGFDDDEEQDEYQRAVDHVRKCRCTSCTEVCCQLDGEGINVSIGQAS